MNLMLRWIIRRDVDEVVQIEESSFGAPWTEGEFMRCLKQREVVGMVAEHDHEIAGFIIYELHKSKLWILNFAVSPSMRRMGVGQQLVACLIGKLSQQRRNQIVLDVRETNLDAQLFFRAQGFSAAGIIPERYDDGEDAYHFQHNLQPLEHEPVNRLSAFFDES